VVDGKKSKVKGGGWMKGKQDGADRGKGIGQLTFFEIEHVGNPRPNTVPDFQLHRLICSKIKQKPKLQFSALKTFAFSS